jgi:hypothetical protein
MVVGRDRKGKFQVVRLTVKTRMRKTLTAIRETGSTACTDPCGGRSAMAVPTATAGTSRNPGTAYTPSYKLSRHCATRSVEIGSSRKPGLEPRVHVDEIHQTGTRIS